MSRHYHLAQLGAYDIESLGDTMFPRALEYALKPRLEDFDVDLYSLHANAHPYNALQPVHALAELSQRQREYPYDALIIGGGEFITFNKIEFTVDGKQVSYPEGWLWRNAISEAEKAGITVIVNAVGMPRDIDRRQQQILHDTLGYAKLISVRDVFSKARLDAADLAERSYVVPDSVWLLNKMYSADELRLVRQSLSDGSVDFSHPYIAVQYGTTRDLNSLARQLRKIRADLDLGIILIPVNYAHDDLLFAKELNECAGNEFAIAAKHMEPIEIMSIIAGAEGFIGTSFHGNVVAASYGVPFAGIDMYPDTVGKMDGLFTMLGLEQCLCPREIAVASTFEEAFSKFNKDQILQKVRDLQNELDIYFDRMAGVIAADAQQ